MVRAAYVIAALSFLMAGLLLWIAYGPAIFFAMQTLYNMCF
jgi:hypothetical protein